MRLNQIVNKANRLFPYTVFVFIALFLVIIWFHRGDLIAGGEDGLLFQDPARLYKLFQNVWFETASGIAVPYYLSRLPLFFAASLLHGFLPSWVIQAVYFWLLLTVGLISAYLFTFFLFKSKLAAFISSVFYLFNLYTMSQIWRRGIYSGFSLWAYFPLFLFLFLNYISSGKLKYLLLLGTSFLIFSDVFSQPANILIIWISGGVVFLSFTIAVLIKETRRQIYQKIIRFIFSLLAFVFTSIWWLYPDMVIARLSQGGISSPEANFASLRGVSQYFLTSQILLLRQSFLFGKESLWHSFYQQGFIHAISIGALLLVVLGIIVTRKEKFWICLASLIFVGWFISKGSNPPLGYEFFKFLFSTFPFTAVLRNSYEKFGVVFVLPYAIFLGLGLNWLREKFKGTVLVAICCFLFLVLLVWPMWNESFFQNARVKVPEYYKMADKYFSGLNHNGRLLVLPMLPGDGVRYNWPDGNYQGIEPSETLFKGESISKILRVDLYDRKYSKLYSNLINGGNYDKDLNEFNVEYLLVHKDLDAAVSGSSTSAQITNLVRKNPKIIFLKNFGKLSFYEYKGDRLGIFQVKGDTSLKFKSKKLSASHYKVSIRGADKPYKLIFKNTYYPLWIARINGKQIKNHYPVLGYANCWKVYKKGDYTVDIIFKVWPWE